MKNYYWIIITIVVLILFTVGILWYVGYGSRVDKTPVTTPTIPKVTSSSEASSSATKKNAVETIKLKAVGSYTGSGTTTRIFIDGKFTHTITAALANPAAGKFYEGWLVNMSKTPPFFSTGPVENIDGVYKLTYETDVDYSSYTMVVITEETSDNGFDGIPEAHVLEGLF